eukprot:scpid85567/ scgid5440/ 
MATLSRGMKSSQCPQGCNDDATSDSPSIDGEDVHRSHHRRRGRGGGCLKAQSPCITTVGSGGAGCLTSSSVAIQQHTRHAPTSGSHDNQRRFPRAVTPPQSASIGGRASHAAALSNLHCDRNLEDSAASQVALPNSHCNRILEGGRASQASQASLSNSHCNHNLEEHNSITSHRQHQGQGHPQLPPPPLPQATDGYHQAAQSVTPATAVLSTVAMPSGLRSGSARESRSHRSVSACPLASRCADSAQSRHTAAACYNGAGTHGNGRSRSVSGTRNSARSINKVDQWLESVSSGHSNNSAAVAQGVPCLAAGGGGNVCSDVISTGDYVMPTPNDIVDCSAGITGGKAGQCGGGGGTQYSVSAAQQIQQSARQRHQHKQHYDQQQQQHQYHQQHHHQQHQQQQQQQQEHTCQPKTSQSMVTNASEHNHHHYTDVNTCAMHSRRVDMDTPEAIAVDLATHNRMIASIQGDCNPDDQYPREGCMSQTTTHRNNTPYGPHPYSLSGNTTAMCNNNTPYQPHHDSLQGNTTPARSSGGSNGGRKARSMERTPGRGQQCAAAESSRSTCHHQTGRRSLSSEHHRCPEHVHRHTGEGKGNTSPAGNNGTDSRVHRHHDDTDSNIHTRQNPGAAQDCSAEDGGCQYGEGVRQQKIQECHHQQQQQQEQGHYDQHHQQIGRA